MHSCSNKKKLVSRISSGKVCNCLCVIWSQTNWGWILPLVLDFVCILLHCSPYISSVLFTEMKTSDLYLTIVIVNIIKSLHFVKFELHNSLAAYQDVLHMAWNYSHPKFRLGPPMTKTSLYSTNYI